MHPALTPAGGMLCHAYPENAAHYGMHQIQPQLVPVEPAVFHQITVQIATADEPPVVVVVAMLSDADDIDVLFAAVAANCFLPDEFHSAIQPVRPLDHLQTPHAGALS